MINNPTINGLDRETLAFALGFKCHGHKNRTDQQADKHNALDKIRALLDAPAVEPQEPRAPFYISVDDWNLLVRGDVEIASVRVSRAIRGKFTEPLFANAPEVAALQSTIAQLQAQLAAQKENLESAVNNSMMFAEQADYLQARIAELESGRGEPTGYVSFIGNGVVRVRTLECLAVEQPLYTAPPAPVAVVLPARMNLRSSDGSETYETKAWNACLDATAALNGVEK